MITRMSGVVSKLTSGLSRSQSLTLPINRLDRSRSGSLRRLHGSVLNPRGSKIRHLNASHSLLIDLDKHIAKVQELEMKVLEMELTLQQREASKAQNINNMTIQKTLTEPALDQSLRRCLVSEEDRAAFQNRLLEAKRKAEQLSRKTSIQENNILRSWHSARLKAVLDSLNSSSTSSTSNLEANLKFLPCPEQIEDDNQIFSCLDSFVEIANDQSGREERSPMDILTSLIVERENIKQYIDKLRNKVDKSCQMNDECSLSLQNIQNSIAALHLQIQSSHYYLGSMLRKENSNAIWIYGPNPIFNKLREVELNSSFENIFAEEMLKKMEISRLHAENNLSLSQTILRRYKKRLMKATQRLQDTNTRIESQVEAVNTAKDAEHIAVFEKVCEKAAADVAPDVAPETLQTTANNNKASNNINNSNNNINISAMSEMEK